MVSSSLIITLFLFLILGTFATVIIFKTEKRHRLITTVIAVHSVIIICLLTFIAFVTSMHAVAFDNYAIPEYDTTDYDSFEESTYEEDSYESIETNSEEEKIDCVLNGKAIGPDDPASRLFGGAKYCNEID